MGYSEDGFQGFYPLRRTPCFNSSTRFPELVKSLFPTFLLCPCDL